MCVNPDALLMCDQQTPHQTSHVTALEESDIVIVITTMKFRESFLETSVYVCVLDSSV